MRWRHVDEHADEEDVEVCRRARHRARNRRARLQRGLKDGEGWDVVLLGPQIGYQADKLKAKLGDTPMDVMPMLEYGRQNCEAIFARIDKALGK